MRSNPFYDPYQILTKIYSGGAFVQQAIKDTYIEELNKARTVKTVYGVLEEDLFLDFCIRTFTEKSPKLAVKILLKISLYALIYMDKKKYAVTDMAVELIKKLGKGGVAGFVNAFLRRFELETVLKNLPKGDEGESLRCSYPLYAYRKLKKEYKERAESIAKARSSGLTVRFVSGKEKYDALLPISTPFENVSIFQNFQRDDGFFKGEYTFQSVGSVAICSVIEPCEALLDACSAPGGKAVYLSEKCKSVTAFELHPHRVELIKEYVKRMHRENVTALVKDSTVYEEQYEEQFDEALVDAPCSGFGTVSENPDIKLFRKEEDFLSLEKTQLAILNATSRYVKKDGVLYYSTCSVFEEENDKTVERFLKGNGNYEVEEITSPLAFSRKKYGLQFLPDTAFGAGFYVAKLRRKS